MPILKVMRLGQPSTEGYFEAEVSYRDALRQLGLPTEGTLTINGVTPAGLDDTFNADTTVHLNAQVKGA